MFSSSGTSQVTGSVAGTWSGGASGGSATISGTTISGLKANFTAPGQSVTYSFYAHNVGSYLAYLRKVSFGTGKNCVAGTNTNSEMVNSACDDISVSVTVGGSVYSNDEEVIGHSLAVGAYENVVVKMTYSSNGAVADGDFSVSFGDISLEYSSVDGSVDLMTFYLYHLNDEHTDTYSVPVDMTWEEFVNSSYSGGKFAVDEGTIIYIAAGRAIRLDSSFVAPEDPIYENATYTAHY